MDFFEVVRQLTDESALGAAWLAVLGVFVLYAAVFRRVVRSVLDPLTVVAFFSACASAFLVVLVALDLVTFGRAGFVVATLVLLYFPLVVYEARRSPAANVSRRGSRFTVPSNASIWCLLCVHVLLQAVIYGLFGVPLFNESRLTTFAEGGGVGVWGRLKDGVEFAATVLAFIRLDPRRRRSLASRLLIASIVVSLILSGSKGAIINVLFAWYLSQVYQTGRWKLPGWSKRRWVAISVAIALVPPAVLLSQGGGRSEDLGDVARAIAIRVVAEGDGYAYFLSGDRIDSISAPDALAVIRPVLTALRLAAPETAITPGFEVMRDLFGDESGQSGPNTRLPLFILFFYGTAGLLLALGFGIALVLSRRYVLICAHDRPIRFALAASVYLACVRVEIDPQITVNGLLNLMFVTPLFAAVSMLGSSRRRHEVVFATVKRLAT